VEIEAEESDGRKVSGYSALEGDCPESFCILNCYAAEIADKTRHHSLQVFK
jgi:hypothetical protein